MHGTQRRGEVSFAQQGLQDPIGCQHRGKDRVWKRCGPDIPPDQAHSASEARARDTTAREGEHLRRAIDPDKSYASSTKRRSDSASTASQLEYRPLGL